MDYKIVKIQDCPQLKERAALWFHQKWGIPLEAYLQSMEECLNPRPGYFVPQWYVVMEGEDIIGGLGVIEKTLPQMYVLSM